MHEKGCEQATKPTTNNDSNPLPMPPAYSRPFPLIVAKSLMLLGRLLKLLDKCAQVGGGDGSGSKIFPCARIIIDQQETVIS